MYRAATPIHTPSGHIEQPPSGSWRANAYAGNDPLTGYRVQYVVKGGRKLRKATKTHQDWSIAIDRSHVLRSRKALDEVMAALAEAGVRIPASAYLFSNDPAHARPWNPDWLS